MCISIVKPLVTAWYIGSHYLLSVFLLDRTPLVRNGLGADFAIKYKRREES